jgi:hypothetical protein
VSYTVPDNPTDPELAALDIVENLRPAGWRRSASRAWCPTPAVRRASKVPRGAARHAVQFGVVLVAALELFALTSGMSSASTGIICSVRSVCALHTTHCRPNVTF